MALEAFIEHAWATHAERPEEVAAELARWQPLLSTVEQIPRFGQLALHVHGEHLGAWQSGLALMAALRSVPGFASGTEADLFIRRAEATLRLAASGDGSEIEPLGASDRARVFAQASSALAPRELRRAAEYFERALELASALPDGDPAQRALAVTGNNLAAELEEKPARGELERELMLRAARTARRQWALAGNWRNIFFAEYRLARSHLEAGLPRAALEHALAALDLCRDHSATAAQYFWAYEGLALAQHALGRADELLAAVESTCAQLLALDPSTRAACERAWSKLEGLKTLHP